jgi:fatty acid desaturase
MGKNRRRLLLILFVMLVLFSAFQVLTFSNLEITVKEYFSIYRSVSFLLFSLLLMSIGIALPKDYDGLFGRVVLIFLILFTGLLWVFMTVFFPFDDAKSDHKVLFVNKENAKLRIIEQVNYAGAIGSDHYDTVLTYDLIKNVRWTKPIQVSDIDDSAWLPVAE